jgi:hypothetical protein
MEVIMTLFKMNRFVTLLTCVALPCVSIAQKNSKQKKQGTAVGGFPTAPAGTTQVPTGSSAFGSSGDPLTTDPELESFSTEAPPQESEYLKAGNWSLDLAALQGGSLWKQGAAGVRYFLSASQALSFDLLAGYDKQKEQSSYGLSLTSLSYFVHKGRAQPFAFLQLVGGIDKTKKTQNTKEAADDKFKGGVSLGLGVEVFLLKELSVSARAGISSQLVPSDALQVATGTGELGLHFLVGAE